MSLHSILAALRTVPPLPRSRRAGFRPRLEPLDDRCLPSFSPAASYAVGELPQDVVTADLNSDGRLDLAVANWWDSTVSVLLGNADGTFPAARTSATGAQPLSVAVGDFNADGMLDLATANEYDVSVLLGNGDGTFGAPSSIAIGAEPASVAVGDFNGDGKMDLGVTANTYYGYWYGYYGTANVLLGNGDGSFSAPISNFLEWGVHTSAAVADFNGDGIQDFAAANADYWTVSVLLGNGAGTLLYGGTWFPTGASPWSVAAGDVNGDRMTDLVTANWEGSASVLLGDGAGGFAAAQDYAAGSGSTSVVLGDFNRDAILDIATANSGGDNVSILRGVGDGTFGVAENFAAGSGTHAVAAGDFNGDGWLDAAAANAYGNNVSVLINDQSWPFPPPPSVSVSDATVTEGNTGAVSATFTLTLSYATAVDVTVHYDTANLTAAAGSDYTAASGTVTIPAGQTSRTFAIAVVGDRLPEPTETFAVNLSAPTNATIGDGQGVGTIIDDEPRISINDVTKSEGNNKRKTTLFTFTVTLSAAYDQAVTMSFRTVDGTATTGDDDYVAQAGTLTFAPGETTKTITIEVKGDRKREANETFYLELFAASSNAWFQDALGLGTIWNDD